MAAIVTSGTTERSIDPQTITNVWPQATMPRATERTRMFSRLKLPPSTSTSTHVTDQDEGEQDVDASLAAAAGDLPDPPEPGQRQGVGDHWCDQLVDVGLTGRPGA